MSYDGGIRPLILVAIALALTAVVPAGDAAEAISRVEDAEQENTITDIDGNVYHTVVIGSQVWLVENLRATRYRSGRPIPRVPDDDTWSRLNTGAYCLPALDRHDIGEGYGLLYNFYAVSDTCGLCPEGWHVPSAEEWRVLIEYLGGDGIAGGRMKAPGSGHWKTVVPGQNGSSGFSGLPAGGRGRYGGAGEAGNYATWWASTSHDSAFAWHWGLYPDRNGIRSNPGHKASGFSVRCIGD